MAFKSALLSLGHHDVVQSVNGVPSAWPSNCFYAKLTCCSLYCLPLHGLVPVCDMIFFQFFFFFFKWFSTTRKLDTSLPRTRQAPYFLLCSRYLCTVKNCIPAPPLAQQDIPGDCRLHLAVCLDLRHYLLVICITGRWLVGDH